MVSRNTVSAVESLNNSHTNTTPVFMRTNTVAIMSTLSGSMFMAVSIDLWHLVNTFVKIDFMTG